ncbi:hypothetical protein [Streptomyces cucumeris]|uniref:hypothetical protein n=1 Tax=Streptomyces cucumeris TaxID=2962890 RepID=UPI0020C8EB86|nr:hypothetical protein [Streptomyces sp. NEAU-Y11]MCP9209719.1 hypothetical protein [Streptomyces sp. NEAU-Y11]
MLDWQLDIYRRLDTGLPNTPVFLEGVPESTQIVKDPSGFYKPSLIVWFGQAFDLSGFGGRISVADLCGMSGEDTESTKQAGFIVESVAPSGLSLLQLAQAVRDLLVGYTPADQGELSEAGSGTVRDPYPVGVGDTLRFYLAIGYKGTVNVGKYSETGS